MKHETKAVRTAKGMKKYTFLGCPLTRNRSAWCYRMCKPTARGRGRCGRIAPHALKSRIQRSIVSHNKKLREAHYEKLERMYLDAACNQLYDAGIRVFEGNADIVIPARAALLDALGTVHDSVCYHAMSDAAQYAVASMIQETAVVAVHFTTTLSRSVAAGALVARGRFVGLSGEHYLAEAVLTDPEGVEIGHGSGAFKASEIALADVPGYRLRRAAKPKKTAAKRSSARP